MSKKAHSSANLKMPDRNASINRTFSSMGDSSLQGMATSTQWHAPCKSVTHQPGLICYPSTRTVPQGRLTPRWSRPSNLTAPFDRTEATMLSIGTLYAHGYVQSELERLASTGFL